MIDIAQRFETGARVIVFGRSDRSFALYACTSDTSVPSAHLRWILWVDRNQVTTPTVVHQIHVAQIKHTEFLLFIWGVSYSPVALYTRPMDTPIYSAHILVFGIMWNLRVTFITYISI